MSQRKPHPLFDQSEARVDIDHWIRTDVWRTDEAAAISLGFEPRFVNTETLKPYLQSSQQAEDFDRRLMKIVRAIEKGTLTELFGPIEFFRWATGNDLQLPPDMVEAITTLPSLRQPEPPELEALRVENEILKRELETSKAANRDLRPRELRSLQIMVAAMAKKFGFDPNASRTSAVAEIVRAAELIGCSIDPHTVLTHLLNAYRDQGIQRPAS